MTERKTDCPNPEKQLQKLQTKFFDWMENGSDAFEFCALDDLEVENYNNFLNKVTSRDDLIAGLEDLDPIFENTLEIAKQMSEDEFQEFKQQLKREREIAGDPDQVSTMEEKYMAIMIPDNAFQAALIAQKFDVSWGLAMYKIKEIELQDKISSQ